MDEVVFNINYLLAPVAELRLETVKSFKEKAEILCDLLNIPNCRFFNTFEINEIKAFYIEQLNINGMPARELESLTQDNINLVLEYAEYFPDIKLIKDLINSLLTRDLQEEAENEAVNKISVAKQTKEKQERDKAIRFFDKLNFDDDNIKEDNRISLSAHFSNAQNFLNKKG